MPLLESILSEWLDLSSEVKVAPHNASKGLSGAEVWKVETAAAQLCLKRWPAGQYTRQDLAERHALLKHVSNVGACPVPVPMATRTGDTVVEPLDRLWDLTTWLPGEPLNRESACEAALDNAMHCLAEFHKAAASFAASRTARSPGLGKRRDILQDLKDGELHRLGQALEGAKDRPWYGLLRELVKSIERTLPTTLSASLSAGDFQLPLQWCLRDVKCDHVLMQAGQVTGLIDYGAAAIESVSGDLARLLGSVADPGSEPWQQAIAEYQNVRPLSEAELRAIAIFHTGGTIAAAANWLRWILIERRDFPQPELVQLQLHSVLRNLKTLS